MTEMDHDLNAADPATTGTALSLRLIPVALHQILSDHLVIIMI